MRGMCKIPWWFSSNINIPRTPVKYIIPWLSIISWFLYSMIFYNNPASTASSKTEWTLSFHKYSPSCFDKRTNNWTFSEVTYKVGSRLALYSFNSEFPLEDANTNQNILLAWKSSVKPATSSSEKSFNWNMICVSSPLSLAPSTLSCSDQ